MTKRVDVSLYGFGNVGYELVRLMQDKAEYIEDRYGIRLMLTSVTGSRFCIVDKHGLDKELLLKLGKGSDALKRYAEINPEAICRTSELAGDVLVDATPTRISNGQPGLDIIMSGIEKNMNIVALSKGALITAFGEIIRAARQKGVKIRYSGAVAAALPTIDTGEFSLAGCKILSIEGILNGTSNFILTRMEEGISFGQALQEARDKGIAEADCSLDINGTDSACKLLLLANSLMGASLSLDDVRIQGIGDITSDMQAECRSRGKVLKLIASANAVDGKVKAEVLVRELPLHHMLAGVSGTSKGIVFNTDSMGSIAVSGGASSPRGAAAAALKDIINLYR